MSKNNKNRLIGCFVLFCLLSGSEISAENSYEWFWFVYENDRASVYPSTLVTPFYFTSKNKDVKYSASLPPLIFSEYAGNRSVSRKWLLGFIEDTDYVHSGGVKDYDVGIFPFVLYGKSKDEKDRYLFLWPVGGTIKGKLGMDYISPWIFPGVALFFLFPPSSFAVLPLYAAASIVPAYVSYGDGDYHAHGILWPLVQWGNGPLRSDFRIMPFYAHNSKEKYYDNYSYGLIVNYDRTFYKNDRELKTFMVFPFFARRWMNDGTEGASSILWPFFSWGYNKRQGNLEINAPWPFITYQKSEDPFIRKFILFPLYGSTRYRRDETRFITPLYFSMTRENDSFNSSYKIIGLIGWYFTRDYRNSESPYYGRRWSYLKIWPLMRYESNDKGDLHFNMLSLLPFRDPGGYEKIYDPLWSIAEYHSEKGIKRFGLFMRTYYQRWSDDSFQSKIPLLYSYASSGGKIRHFLFLMSMFGIEKNREGTYLRIAWIPVRTGEGLNIEDDSSEDLSDNTGANAIPQYASRQCEPGIVIGSALF